MLSSILSSTVIILQLANAINVIINLIIDRNNFTACEYNKCYHQSPGLKTEFLKASSTITISTCNKSYHTHTINVIINHIIDHNNFTACEYNKCYHQSCH
jgi:hypothetical protein